MEDRLNTKTNIISTYESEQSPKIPFEYVIQIGQEDAAVHFIIVDQPCRLKHGGASYFLDDVPSKCTRFQPQFLGDYINIIDCVRDGDIDVQWFLSTLIGYNSV